MSKILTRNKAADKYHVDACAVSDVNVTSIAASCHLLCYVALLRHL